MILHGFYEESENLNSLYKIFGLFPIEGLKSHLLLKCLFTFIYSVLTSDKFSADKHERSSSGNVVYYRIRH